MDIFVYSTKSPDQVVSEIKSSVNGLTTIEATQRQKLYGRNEIVTREHRWWQMLLEQWRSPFIYLLFFAALIALLVTHDYVEGGMILVIVGLNTILGFYQEFKASQALKLLKTYLVSYAKVIRDGKAGTVPTVQLAPGDIVVLEPGDIVPADMRLLTMQGLLVDESVLTGESVQVHKTTGALAQQATGPTQATNMLFTGTTIVGGTARGLVVAIGSQTSLGQISKLMTETVRESSFAKGIGQFSSFILRFIILTIIGAFIACVLIRGIDFVNAEMLIFAVSLAVTIIPEMLPTISTVSLARGALELAQHKVVVKRLTAIEDLGSIQILCTDKTGTLTENELVVADVLADDPRKAVTSGVLLSSGNSSSSKKQVISSFDTALLNYLTDAERADIKSYEFIDRVPFEPERRRASALIKKNGQYMLVVRGAYEEILKNCVNVSAEYLNKIHAWIADQGKEGKRVIAVAQKQLTNTNSIQLKNEEQGMTFVGIISFVDPIKKSTYEAIRQAQDLGLRIKILTGDSPEVAGAVAYKIKLILKPDELITGDGFAALTAEEKAKAANHYAVFARISPQQKYEIISYLQKKFEVGYLGDGINDAPALKLANVAIVVKGAAEVAQEAADIVLLKKSLFVIVDGIRQGRKIFANTVKYIKTTIASNIGHFYALVCAWLFLDFLPLLPLQLLLLNIITDFPMISLSTDSVDTDQLKEPKMYDIKEIALFAMALSPISTIYDFVIYGLFHNRPISVLQTNWFLSTVLTEIFIILSFRTTKLWFRAAPPSKTLLACMGIASIITFVIPYTTFGHTIFNFSDPTVHDLGLLAVVGCGYFFATELSKVLYYRMFSKPSVS